MLVPCETPGRCYIPMSKLIMYRVGFNTNARTNYSNVPVFSNIITVVVKRLVE